MENPNRILVVDDERINLENISHILKQKGYDVIPVDNGLSAVQKLEQEHFDLVITDLKMADVDGIQVMETTKNHLPDAEVIVVTGYATVTQAVELMANGAFYFLAKPIKLEELLSLVQKALEKSALKNEVIRLRQQIDRNKGASQFVGRTPSILKLKETIYQIAQLHSNVIITGETGTGKELVARLIHELGPRSQKRFLPINCAALSEELVLNELFGHEQDAFSGAGKTRQGLLESADGGIVLFDEIGEMPITAQVKILRVLQEKKILRIGGNREIPVDVRILATTNLDLAKEMEVGRFRKDLFYRLNVISLHIPPLRERRDDIPLLIRHFLAKYPGVDDQVKSITPEALEFFQRYNFQGNVRELENIIEYAVAICNDTMIAPSDLPVEIRKPSVESAGTRLKEQQAPSLELTEREHILSVLESAGGNKTKAAKLLGIDRVSLWRKLKKFEKE